MFHVLIPLPLLPRPTGLKHKIQVAAALARIQQEPKPLAWRVRDRVGDRVKWYKEVEEVQ